MSNKPVLSIELKLNDRQECDLIRFHETCEDSQPYDVSKEGMKSLARIGLVRSLGFSRYELTDVGSATVYKLLEFLRHKPANRKNIEPDAWVNGQQLLLCSKSPRVVEPENPMMHNLPRNIAGSALRTDYCDTPLFAEQPVSVMPDDWEDQLFAEMSRRFDLRKMIDDDHMVYDDTQIGVEFARDWVKARLSGVKP